MSIECAECGLMNRSTETLCQLCGAQLARVEDTSDEVEPESKAQDQQSHIHRWDRPAFVRALLWSLCVEGIFAGFYALGYVAGGAPPTGAPHNFPHPLILISILYHLPSIFTVGWIDTILVPPFQTLLLTYVIFVWLRLKKIRVKLY